MPKHVVAVVGSYRKDGMTHQAVKVLLDAVKEKGATVEKIDLLEKRVEFCRNCRACMQIDREQSRGRCVQEDQMPGILDSIDSADAVIFASPVNMFSPTALMKRFMERLSVYAYWPWKTPFPKTRTQPKRKTVVVLTSSAAPGPIVALFGSAWVKSLKTTAKSMIKPGRVVSIHLGGVAMFPDQRLSEAHRRKLVRKAGTLLR